MTAKEDFLGSIYCSIIAEFRRKNHSVAAEESAVVVQDGRTLSQSASIAFHSASDNNGFLRNSVSSSECDKFVILDRLFYCQSHLEPVVKSAVFESVGLMQQQQQQQQQQSVDVLMRSAKKLDDELSRCTFLVGDRLSVADVVTAVVLMPAFIQLPERLRTFLHLGRWYRTVLAQREAEKVLKKCPSLYSDHLDDLKMTQGLKL